MVRAGTIIAPDEVRLELARGGDEVYEWATAHGTLFLEPDEEVQAVVQQIVDAWPEFVPEESHDGVWADPYVIALAAVRGAAVVTGENVAPANARRPKIPNVCQALGVRWMTLLQVLRTEEVTF